MKINLILPLFFINSSSKAVIYGKDILKFWKENQNIQRQLIQFDANLRQEIKDKNKIYYETFATQSNLREYSTIESRNNYIENQLSKYMTRYQTVQFLIHNEYIRNQDLINRRYITEGFLLNNEYITKSTLPEFVNPTQLEYAINFNKLKGITNNESGSKLFVSSSLLTTSSNVTLGSYLNPFSELFLHKKIHLIDMQRERQLKMQLGYINNNNVLYINDKPFWSLNNIYIGESNIKYDTESSLLSLPPVIIDNMKFSVENDDLYLNEISLKDIIFDELIRATSDNLKEII